MRRRPSKLLVCQVLISIIILHGVACADDDTLRVIVNPPLHHGENSPLISARQAVFDASADESAFVPASAGSATWPAVGRFPAPGKPITKCSVGVCPPAPSSCGPACLLPQRRWRQWEFSAQAFYARVRGKLSWTDSLTGFVHPDTDFNDGLGLPDHKWLMEYSARYQFRPHWSCFYSIMPIEMDQTYQNPRFPGTVFHTKWEHVYQRVGIMYQPIVSCNASVSIYSTWLFMDQKYTLKAGSHCPLSGAVIVDRTRQMVMSGIEIQKCIRTLCNGGTLSCDNRVGIGYLDGTFGLDVQAGMRFSVPMNCGRWGYARGGYRLVDFKEDRNDLRMDHTLEGWFAELGLIF
ncbi:MAG: hypothetical protein V1792_09010 [Pseudomonadota bacterium]